MQHDTVFTTYPNLVILHKQVGKIAVYITNSFLYPTAIGRFMKNSTIIPNDPQVIGCSFYCGEYGLFIGTFFFEPAGILFTKNNPAASYYVNFVTGYIN
jgi:hypothetical protein